MDDGKPLYQRTYVYDNVNLRNYTWNILEDVSNLNIDKLIYSDANGLYNDQFYGSLTKLDTIQIVFKNNNIVIYDIKLNRFNILVSDMTLQYTKTIDQTTNN